MSIKTLKGTYLKLSALGIFVAALMASGTTLADITFTETGEKTMAVLGYIGDTLDVGLSLGDTTTSAQSFTITPSVAYKVMVTSPFTIQAGQSSGTCSIGLVNTTDEAIAITFHPDGNTDTEGDLILTLTIVDPIRPYIVAVHNVGENGIYSTGDTILLEVEFSDVITEVSGNPYLRLDIQNQNPSEKRALYVDYYDKYMYFAYTVQPGDFSEDLDCRYNGLMPNGSTISVNGQAFTSMSRRTLPVGAAAGSLSKNADIAIRTIFNWGTGGFEGREGERIAIEITRGGAADNVQGFTITASQSGKVDFIFPFTIPRNEDSACLEIDLVEATTEPLTLRLHPNGYTTDSGDIVLTISIAPDPIVPKVLLSGVVSAIEGAAPFPIQVSLDRAPRETIFVSVETSDSSKLAIVGCDGDFKNITEEEVVLAFRKGQIGPIEVMLAPRQGVEMGGSPIVVSATADQTYDAAFLPITVLGKAPVATVFPVDDQGTWTLSGFTAGQYVNFSWLAEDSATDIAEGITALVDFGDGTSDCVICNANGIGTARHKYSEAGYFFLMLTLVDKSGYRTSLLGQVTVELAANPITGQGGGGTSSSVGVQDSVMLSVTNIVLHYVTQSIPSDAVIPPIETGIVNVLTEVSASSAIAIPSDWAAQYPSFADKFGDDFGAAITKPSGKRDGAGNQMFVWQDFVAGTDPTNLDDVLLASITYDAQSNEPIISWSPELSEEEAAKRSYRSMGKSILPMMTGLSSMAMLRNTTFLR